MSPARSFSAPVLAAARDGKILGVRAGDEHRFTAVWAVVVHDRVFARSWNDKPTGWRRAFLAEPNGVIQVPMRDAPAREVRVRARPVRGERLLDAIDLAYAEKFDTPASRKWVRGLCDARRRLTTTEFVPR